ncbi:MAG TPA: 2-phospho-L-lactate guanylyltransferase [Candidatus Binataceae bacterium]|nr:2-phospho-L-lactate guanylyltransferase [Candidatus Binataceae bacterium]
MRTVLIAAKELALAKTRLGPALAAAERAALAEAMFRDVLAAALSSRTTDRIAVVSSDRLLLELASGSGALAIDEGFPRGLNAAVALATAALTDGGPLCTVLSDCPMTRGEDIDAVFGAMPAGAGAVLVPSRDLTGTNIIARAPADAIATHFGRMSLVRHRDECRARGVQAEILRLAGPALDLDVVADLLEFVRCAGATHTLNHLARLGIAPH